jgi:hypothetical protein
MTCDCCGERPARATMVLIGTIGWILGRADEDTWTVPVRWALEQERPETVSARTSALCDTCWPTEETPAYGERGAAVESGHEQAGEEYALWLERQGVRHGGYDAERPA